MTKTKWVILFAIGLVVGSAIGKWLAHAVHMM